MKNTIITLALFSIIASAVSAKEVMRDKIFAPAYQIADYLVVKFDADGSDALNKLELSEAVTYLSENHPMLTIRLDYDSGQTEFSSPPRIAYNLVEGFDSDSDVQLTEEELSLAISYLRRLSRVNSDLVAYSE